jgi:hypothetical protein
VLAAGLRTYANTVLVGVGEWLAAILATELEQIAIPVT